MSAPKQLQAHSSCQGLTKLQLGLRLRDFDSNETLLQVSGAQQAGAAFEDSTKRDWLHASAKH